jgi:undecaprenyl-diphosphatase
LELLTSLILGVIQGLTEFLPVSSSGHLEIGKAIFGNDWSAEESMLMTVVLHFATALSTIVIFRKEISNIIKGLFSKEDKTAKKFSFFIIVSMIPAALVGVLFDDIIESFFDGNLLLVSLMLVVTGGLLFLADRAKGSEKKVGIKESILIGIAQAVAILPGISRSGATISTSVLLGVDREQSARFSFLMVVPLIFGKMAKDILDGAFDSIDGSLISYGVGFLAAFITGLFACTWMIKLVKKSQLKYFSIYCFIVAAFTLFIISF